MINNQLYKRHETSIHKFYEDACLHHGVGHLNVTVDSGGHSLGHYLTVTTEKDDTWSIDDGYQDYPTLYFSPEGDWEYKEIFYTAEWSSRESASHKVIQHEDGTFTLGIEKYSSEEELLKKVKTLVESDDSFFERNSKSLGSEEGLTRLTEVKIV